MTDKLRDSLSQLIGLELTGTTRAANMQCLKFGFLRTVKKNSDIINAGEFGLHLQCNWRLTNETEIIVGSNDLYEPPDEDAKYDENFNWDIPKGNLRDKKLGYFLKTNNPIVSTITTDQFGGFEIKFGSGIKLTAFPTSTRKYEYSEYWRLLDNKEPSKKHFVVGARGIEN